MSDQIKVVVVGAGGRMGGTYLIPLLMKTPGFQLVGAVESEGYLTKNSNAVIGNIAMVSNIEEVGDRPDVIIDFGNHAATMHCLNLAVIKGLAYVGCVTGYTPAEREFIQAHAPLTRSVFSSNMSVAVNVMLRAASLMAKALGDGFDVEIFEIHHGLKKDAPSGTALMLGEAVALAKGMEFAESAVHNRHGHVGQRQKKEIGLQALRGGDVAGEHTVFFLGQKERLELVQRATSPEVFAAGALQAAKWIIGQPNGLYDMQDVLGA